MSLDDIKEKLSIIFRAILLTTVILLSFFAGHAVSKIIHYQINDLSGLWCAITAVVVFDDVPANAKNLLRDRLLGTLVGAIVAGAAVTILGHILYSICVALFLVSIIISLFKWHGALKIACVTVLIVCLTTENYSAKDVWISSGMRFVVGVIGGSISWIATSLIVKGRKLGFFTKKTDSSAAA